MFQLSSTRARRETCAVRALLIGNEGDNDPGIVGAALLAEGFTLHNVVRETLTAPPATGDFDLVVSLGSEWSIPGRSAAGLVDLEITALRQAHAADTAILGICFGGQLLATALGGSVHRSPAPEVGLYDVETDDPELIPSGPWVQWHYDRFDAPADATVLARTESATQAFIVGRALGIQFHPEVDDTIVTRWAAGDADLPGIGRTPDAVLQSVRPGLDRSAELGRRLVHTFLRRVRLS